VAEVPGAGDQGVVFKPGASVGSYEVVRLLGRGGMGEVYLARDATLARKVALKVIHSRHFSSAKAVKLFLSEARTTARFNHPHIVTVYAAGQHEGTPYVALELLEGQTLRQRMESGDLETPEAVIIAQAMARALAEAHQHGVLHQDLKPENVLISDDGRIKVVDFGLATAIRTQQSGRGRGVKREDPGQGAVELERGGTVDMGRGRGAALEDTVRSLTAWEGDVPALSDSERESIVTTVAQLESQGSGIRGTPLYMAPEQWLEKEKSDATDVWALGVVLHELLTGRRPFDGVDNLAALAVCVVSEDPTPLDPSLDEAPGRLGEVVARCLRKDPQRRPPAVEVGAALNEVVASLSGPVVEPPDLEQAETPAPVEQEAATAGSRGLWLALAGGVGLLALLGVWLADGAGAGPDRVPSPSSVVLDAGSVPLSPSVPPDASGVGETAGDEQDISASTSVKPKVERVAPLRPKLQKKRTAKKPAKNPAVRDEPAPGLMARGPDAGGPTKKPKPGKIGEGTIDPYENG